MHSIYCRPLGLYVTGTTGDIGRPTVGLVNPVTFSDYAEAELYRTHHGLNAPDWWIVDTPAQPANFALESSP